MTATLNLRNYDDTEWVYCWSASDLWHWRQARGFKTVESVTEIDPQDLINRDEQRIDSDEFIVVKTRGEIVVVQSIDFEDE